MSRSSASLYQSFFAVPFNLNLRAPVRIPRHMTLNLSKHVLRNVSRFRLRAHTLRVDRAIWSRGQEAPICDKFDLHAEDQGEVHVLLKRTCPEVVCQLRRKYSALFQQIAKFSRIGACMQQVTPSKVFNFLSQNNNKLFPYISELMDLFVTDMEQSQANQPNFLAEGP